jgi:hypothetical protein
MTTPPAAAARFRPTVILRTMPFAVLGLVMGCSGGAGKAAVVSQGMLFP